MVAILGSNVLRDYTARGGIMALLNRLPASTLAVILVDLHEALCDEVGEELAGLVAQAGINNCGPEEWAREVEAAEAAAAEAAGLFEEIDAYGFEGVRNAM